MGGSAETEIHGHMSGILWFMEIFSVVFVLAVFVFYFILKRRIKKKKIASGGQVGEKKTDGG